MSLYKFHVFVIERINRISQWSSLCISSLIADSFNNECEQKSSVKLLFDTLTDFTGYDAASGIQILGHGSRALHHGRGP